MYLLRNTYYPSLIIQNGYCSRNIPSVESYKAVYDRRIAAKHSGDKSTANALKLVLNTTYGGTLSAFNDLYDPLKARSVCISGQLYLLELANHLLQAIPGLKIPALNTDGIMCEFDDNQYEAVGEIINEWQARTGFNLEEDKIETYIAKDVNSFVEIQEGGKLKVKGGYLVRGVLTNGNIDFTQLGLPPWENMGGGAFTLNNNAVIVSKAVIDYLAWGTPVEETINTCDNVFAFQIIAKSWAKCGNAVHEQSGWKCQVQRVNRVYATDRYEFGTLYQWDPDTENYRKISGIPEHCIVDNSACLGIEAVDKDWYIRLAKRYINDFLGIKPRKNAAVTRKINRMKKGILDML